MLHQSDLWQQLLQVHQLERARSVCRDAARRVRERRQQALHSLQAEISTLAEQNDGLTSQLQEVLAVVCSREGFYCFSAWTLLERLYFMRAYLACSLTARTNTT